MKTVTVAGLLFALALIFGYAGASRAQQSGGSAPAAHPGAAAQSGSGPKAMDADTPEDDASLNLTDEQKAQIQTIRDDAKQQVAATQKDSSLSDEAKQQKLKVIRKDTRRQVWGVMTPEQQKQWAAEQRERRETKHGGSATPAPKPQT
jgi:Spy/CpxP family protein refolding chaperone